MRRNGSACDEVNNQASHCGFALLFQGKAWEEKCGWVVQSDSILLEFVYKATWW